MPRLLALSALVVALAACGGTSSNAPASHTVSEDGVMHHTGLQDPMTNCTSCHGASLQGDQGPSCTSCHGVKW